MVQYYVHMKYAACIYGSGYAYVLLTPTHLSVYTLTLHQYVYIDILLSREGHIKLADFGKLLTALSYVYSM